MNKNTRLILFLAPAIMVAASPALAVQEVARIPFINAPPGTAGLGGSFRVGTDPYFTNEGKDDVIDLIPLYLYEGKYLFLHGTSGGIHVYRNDNFQFNVIAQFRFQELSPSRDPYFEGISKRKQSFDAGIELVLKGNWGLFKLDWTADTLSRHNGQELDLAYRYNFKRGRWSFSPYISWTWQDENLTNYYYGVSAAEARPDRPEYMTGESFAFGYGINTSYQVSDRLLMFANVGFEGLDTTIELSPLVEEPMVSAALVGATFMFGNVERPIAPEERQSEWTWRVNYGYQADGNIVGEIDQGDFSKSKFVDSAIAGLTLSRLLTDGPRIDFYGRLAIFRHLEEPVQADFNSYAAYIMAVGKGYSPWSGEEVFRWGFGFGMSYAVVVPAQEVIKQTRNGKNTAHFLNYLEMTLDFPLRRAFKKSFLRNCYAGVTVVHRSGIFGTSDILGDVAGGADWITAHLECVRR